MVTGGVCTDSELRHFLSFGMTLNSNGGRSPRNGGGSIEGLVARIRQDFAPLVGKSVESISGIKKEEPDGWRLTVEAIELERIPPSTSVMATYEVVVDGQGQMTEFHRLRRYYRNQADEQ
jgi:Gas vesicle synthesis protein GvpO